MKRAHWLILPAVAVLAAWLLLRSKTHETYRIVHDLTAELDAAAIEMPRLPLEERFRFEGDGWLFRPNGNVQFSSSSAFWNRITFFPDRRGAGRGTVSWRYRTQGPGGPDHRLSFVFHESHKSKKARLEVRIDSSGRAELVFSEGANRETSLAESAISRTNGPWRSYSIDVDENRVALSVDGRPALSSAIPLGVMNAIALDGQWAIEFSRRGESYHPSDALFRRLEISRETGDGSPPLEALAFRRDPSVDEATLTYLNHKYAVSRRYVSRPNRYVLRQAELPLGEGKAELLPALFAPAGSSFRFPLELQPEDRLRVRYGLMSPSSATFRVRLTVDGKTQLVLDAPMSTKPELEEVEVPIPVSSRSIGELELSVHSESRPETVLGILGSPLIVRRLPQSERRRPNVIVISADTLRRDHVGVYGGPHADLTPSINRLAASATVLTKAYSVSPWTMPSHFSLLSARYPSHHGLNRAFGYNPPAVEEAETLAQILARQGYVTAAIASDHSLDPANGFDRGFHSFLDNEVRDVAPLLAPLERFLEQHSKDEFFLFLHSYDAHAPLFRGDKITEDDRARVGDAVEYNDFVELGGANERDRELVHELYAEHVRGYDAAFGRILELFERYGVLDDSIIVFTSDHGEEIFEHGVYQHGHHLWEELLRVPLIMKFPEGHRFLPQADTLTALVDVVPTILDYLNFDIPAGIDGTSFLDVLEGKEKTHRRYLLAEAVAWGPERKAVITDRYKYMVTFADTDLPWLMPRATFYDAVMDTTARAELYDLLSDPSERENVIDREAELAGRLKLLLAPLLEASAQGGAVVVDPARLEALRSLGYIQE